MAHLLTKYITLEAITKVVVKLFHIYKMAKESWPEWPEGGLRRKLETVVGDKVVVTEDGDVAVHDRAVHEETLKQRTPEQIKLIEGEKKAFLDSLKKFDEIASRSFEETGNAREAVDTAVWRVFGFQLDEGRLL